MIDTDTPLTLLDWSNFYFFSSLVVCKVAAIKRSVGYYPAKLGILTRQRLIKSS